MGQMTVKDWQAIEALGYFRAYSGIDKWGDPWKLDRELIFALQRLREYVGKPINVHCGYEQRDFGYHPKGMAVDIHITGLHVVDQFLAASRFPAFAGIGVYPFWNSPGLHLDTRPDTIRATWVCTEEKKYIPLTWDYLSQLN